MNEITTVGADLAKTVITMKGVDATRHTVLRTTVRRERLMELVAELPPCLIGMEACAGAHEWALKFQMLQMGKSLENQANRARADGA